MHHMGDSIYKVTAIQKEIWEFLTGTLSKLIHLASLQLCCRIDLSVMHNIENDIYEYFVTGVSRGLGVKLYGSGEPSTVRAFAYGYLQHFLGHLQDRRKADAN